MKLLVLQYNKSHVQTWILFSISFCKAQAIPECFTKSDYLFMDLCKTSLMHGPACIAFITVIVLVCLLNSYKYDTSLLSAWSAFLGFNLLELLPYDLSVGISPKVLRSDRGASCAPTKLEGQGPSQGDLQAVVGKSKTFFSSFICFISAPAFSPLTSVRLKIRLQAQPQSPGSWGMAESWCCVSVWIKSGCYLAFRIKFDALDYQ